MPRKTAKTVRLDPEDVKALKRAEADGVSPSELVRRSLRVAAARYYRGVRRPPNVTLLVSTDPLLGEESELYKVRILTIDHEDFGPLRVGQRYAQRLEIVP